MKPRPPSNAVLIALDRPQGAGFGEAILIASEGVQNDIQGNRYAIQKHF